MKKINISFNIIILVFFSLLLIVTYLLKIYLSAIPNSSTIEVVTDGIILIISIAIGWALSRLQSFNEFQEALKSFAYSAQRRVEDNLKIINRISKQIKQFRNNYDKKTIHELDVIDSNIENLRDSVNSSKVDWLDIIGEDLEKKEKVEELERKRDFLKYFIHIPNYKIKSMETIEEIDSKISELRSELPYKLRNDIVENEIPYHSDIASQIVSNQVIEHYSKQIEDTHSIELSIIKSPNFSPINENFIHLNGPFSLKVEENEKEINLIVLDKTNKFTGKVKNPIDTVNQKDFVISLFTIICSIYNYTDSLSITPSLNTTIKLPPNLEIKSLEDDIIQIIIPANWWDLAFG